MTHQKTFSFAAVVLALTVGSTASAAPITSTTSVLGGAVIANFEGFTEGTNITNQYPGVTFGQVDGGTPMIDNAPFLFGYGASSGTSVLTGSTNGGAPFPTVAGLTMTFASARSGVEVFFSDIAPLGNYGIRAYGAGNVLLEQFTLLGPGIGAGLYVGFQRGTNDVLRFEVGPSSARGDAFAIDDLRATAADVPEPGTLLLAATGLATIVWRRRRV